VSVCKVDVCVTVVLAVLDFRVVDVSVAVVLVAVAVAVVFE
jgi:hypothetical protein